MLCFICNKVVVELIGSIIAQSFVYMGKKSMDLDVTRTTRVHMHAMQIAGPWSSWRSSLLIHLPAGIATDDA